MKKKINQNVAAPAETPVESEEVVKAKLTFFAGLVASADSFLRFAVEKAMESGQSVREFQATVIGSQPEIAKLALQVGEKLELGYLALLEKTDATSTQIGLEIVRGFNTVNEKIIEKTDLTAVSMKLLDIVQVRAQSRIDLDKVRAATEVAQANTERAKLETEKIRAAYEAEHIKTEQLRQAEYQADAKRRQEEHAVRMANLRGEKPTSGRVEKNG